MAKIKYTITMIREIPNNAFETPEDKKCETDEELLAALKLYVADDSSYIIDDLLTEEEDDLTIELVK